MPENIAELLRHISTQYHGDFARFFAENQERIDNEGLLNQFQDEPLFYLALRRAYAGWCDMERSLVAVRAMMNGPDESAPAAVSEV